ncbi:glycosyltransferase [bacterium]|nr:glycosyltransferase [bacterium]
MDILLVIPTHNERLVIAKNVRTLYRFLESALASDRWTLLVADNGSTDGTVAELAPLLSSMPRLRVTHTDVPGRGNALREAWSSSTADVYAYMDADLATDLADLAPLLAALRTADLAVGSRLSAESAVERGAFREWLSRSYSAIVRAALPLPVRDLQCGFKAIRTDALRAALPHARHDGWFFDTELIAFADALGYRVVEVPVRWKETRDGERKSTVRILPTICDNLSNLLGLRRRIRRFLVN